jgi:hypothetical protein
VLPAYKPFSSSSMHSVGERQSSDKDWPKGKRESMIDLKDKAKDAIKENGKESSQSREKSRMEKMKDEVIEKASDLKNKTVREFEKVKSEAEKAKPFEALKSKSEDIRDQVANKASNLKQELVNSMTSDSNSNEKEKVAEKSKYGSNSSKRIAADNLESDEESNYQKFLEEEWNKHPQIRKNTTSREGYSEYQQMTHQEWEDMKGNMRASAQTVKDKVADGIGALKEKVKDKIMEKAEHWKEEKDHSVRRP